MRFETVERRRVRLGMADVERDRDRHEAWLISVDGTPQSYVDLLDPTSLPFDALRRVADVVDALPPGPLTALHIGGAAGSLPRYVQHTRRGSEQLVVDIDAELVDLVSAHLPLPTGISVRAGNGLDTIRTAHDLDLVVVDAFDGGAVPEEFASAEFQRHVSRTLTGSRTYVVTLVDRPGLPGTTRLVDAIGAQFGVPLVIADLGVLAGTGTGTVVLVSTDAPLPVAELDELARAARFPASVSIGL
ncbi:fused MFS/spermidine synthase [Lentzea sp. NPDC003310]|uniref:spermidine synthase n=1 Tax=Lentzea sp. NPDC003310 TaxID=3154447 RepID=UPI0033AA67D6